jgi:TPR repeat protein
MQKQTNNLIIMVGIRCLLFLLFLLVTLFQPHFVRAGEQLFNDTLQLAEQGDEEAQFSLGLMYDTGNQVKRNPEQAVHWFKKAAAAGIAGACLYLGMKYAFGAGINQNKNKALHWYEQAALQGWPQAAFLLGTLYLDPPASDKVKGCTWLTIARKQGFPGAGQIHQLKCSTLSNKTLTEIKNLRTELERKIAAPVK